MPSVDVTEPADVSALEEKLRNSGKLGGDQSVADLGITINNRELRDVTADCSRALCAANHPPAIFVRAGVMAIVAVDEDHRRVVRAASETYIRGALTRAANFQKTKFNEKTGKFSHTAVFPPLDAVRDLME